MTLVRRSRFFVLLPGILLILITGNLIWDIIKLNLDPGVAQVWPWRFTLLDTPTSAALAGAIAGLLLTRAQFSRTIQPAIGWSGDEEQRGSYLETPAWVVHLYNNGPGRCRIRSVKHSYTLTGQSPSPWGTWDSMVEQLAENGILRNRDYHL